MSFTPIKYAGYAKTVNNNNNKNIVLPFSSKQDELQDITEGFVLNFLSPFHNNSK